MAITYLRWLWRKTSQLTTDEQNRMSSDSTFPAFSERLLDFIERCPQSGPASDQVFEELARELFGLQFGGIPVYRQFCEARGATPGRISHWTEIPAVPTQAFKEFALSSLPEDQRTRVFLSSGTTRGERRSRHFHGFESLRLYEASLTDWFARHLLPDRFPTGGPSPSNPEAADQGPGAGLWFLALTPPGSAAPESSLVHMFETVRVNFHFGGPHFLGRMEGDGAWSLDLPRTVETLEQAVTIGAPVLLGGSAFSFVHLVDHLAETNTTIRLPSGSRVMETGGYKGRSRAVEKSVLHDLIGEWLGVSQACLVSEYGMSELSSQAYDRVAAVPCGSGEGPLDAPAVFRFPPWARARVMSPETGRETAENEVGMVCVFDLANVYSVMAVQTEDLAIRRGSGLELAGRGAAAESRGCSLLARETCAAR